MVVRDLATMAKSCSPAVVGHNLHAYEDMLQALLADSCFFPQYALWELDLVAELLGRMLHFSLLPPGPLLCSALNCIVAALRSPLGSKMTRFAVKALEQLQSGICNFPSLLDELHRLRFRKDGQRLHAALLPYVCRAYRDTVAGHLGCGAPGGGPAGGGRESSPLECAGLEGAPLLPMYVHSFLSGGAAAPPEAGRPGARGPGTEAAARTPRRTQRRESKGSAARGSPRSSGSEGTPPAPGKASRAATRKGRPGQGPGSRHPCDPASQPKAPAQPDSVAPAIKDLRALRAAIESEMKLKPRAALGPRSFVTTDDASMVLVLQEEDLDEQLDRASARQPSTTGDEEALRLLEICR